ncbi:MAG: hypothetical protein IVW55_16235 [Chloroflexi bacterium]|nr:hypothetical protein [Chloroflexota bacterium]
MDGPREGDSSTRMTAGRLIFRAHAIRRIFERGISIADVHHLMLKKKQQREVVSASTGLSNQASRTTT